MNIAIVDDMPRELSRISQILNEYVEEHSISIDINTFQSGEELLKVYRPLQYTLIFMDIYIPKAALLFTIRHVLLWHMPVLDCLLLFLVIC